MKRSIRNPAKLSQAQVLLIRQRGPDGEFTHPCSYWSRIMMVNGETIRRARTGETWNWLDQGLQMDSAEVAAIPSVPVTDDEIARSLAKFKAKMAGVHDPYAEARKNIVEKSEKVLDKETEQEEDGIVGKENEPQNVFEEK